MVDTVTQIQNYVHTLSALFAHSVEHLQTQTPPMPTTAHPDDTPADAIEEKANVIFKRLLEADVLMASLPAELQSEAEQLQIIEELERQNQAAGERLAKAQAEAELWQKRVSAVLKEASTRQLRSTASASAQATPTAMELLEAALSVNPQLLTSPARRAMAEGAYRNLIDKTPDVWQVPEFAVRHRAALSLFELLQKAAEGSISKERVIEIEQAARSDHKMVMQTRTNFPQGLAKQLLDAGLLPLAPVIGPTPPSALVLAAEHEHKLSALLEQTTTTTTVKASASAPAPAWSVSDSPTTATAMSLGAD